MSYTRVNGEMLADYKGQTVCLLGKLKKVSDNQASFEVEASDGKLITIKLKMQLRDILTDIVEVYGKVDERGNWINCTNYAIFDETLQSHFDMELYNETIKMANQLPKVYFQQTA